MRLIDADRLKEVFHRNVVLAEAFDCLIDNAPTIDAKPIEHGSWFGDEDGSVWECNQCGLAWQLNYGTPQENEMNYCPKCGARMDGCKI